MILNATSNCPYHECDGSGMTWLKNTKTLETKARYCKCREEKLQDKRLKFANIPTEFSDLTIRSFNTELYKNDIDLDVAKAAKKITANYVNNFEEFEDKGKGLYYYSSTKGSGKTRLAVSLGNALLSIKHKQVKFITALDMTKEIKNTYNKESKYTESQLIESINSVSVLIIDDIGVEQPTRWVNEILFSIFDTRMKYKKITIFTSNCSMENLDHDDRLKSRIFKMAIPVQMPEEDIRVSQSKEENTKLQDVLLRGDKHERS
jgi:DNA replication protein DnaC